MAKILLIDDETDFRQEMTSLLQSWGYEAFAAASGSSGLDIAKAERPEIAIVDLILPGMLNGYSVISKLHTALPETIIFAITAYYNKNLDVRVSNAGANRVYKKPLDINQLKSDIIDIVGMPEPKKVKEPEPAVENEQESSEKQVNPSSIEIIRLFKYLQKPDYKKLVTMGRIQTLNSSSEIVTSVPQNIILVHSGKISVHLHTKKEIVNAGSTFGSAFIMAKDIQPVDVTIHALETSKITIIEAIHVRNFFKMNPRYTSVFLLELCRILSEQVIAEYDIKRTIRI